LFSFIWAVFQYQEKSVIDDKKEEMIEGPSLKFQETGLQETMSMS
jgi:hypothetical protein